MSMIDNSILLSTAHLNAGVHDLWRYAVINMSNYEDTHPTLIQNCISSDLHLDCRVVNRSRDLEPGHV